MGLIIMLLEMGEVMQYHSHHKFVEEDNAKQSNPGNDSGNNLTSHCIRRIWVLLLCLDGCNQVVGLEELYEIENNCGDN
jgi:hypothetical protein